MGPAVAGSGLQTPLCTHDLLVSGWHGAWRLCPAQPFKAAWICLTDWVCSLGCRIRTRQLVECASWPQGGAQAPTPGLPGGAQREPLVVPSSSSRTRSFLVSPPLIHCPEEPVLPSSGHCTLILRVLPQPRFCGAVEAEDLVLTHQCTPSSWP